MSRTLCLVLAFIAVTNAFNLGNYYVGSMPYRELLKSCRMCRAFNLLPSRMMDLWSRFKYLDAQYDGRLGFGPLRGGREFGIDNPTPELQKDKKDAAPMKRFKPCYYSPIQCLIKRR